MKKQLQAILYAAVVALVFPSLSPAKHAAAAEDTADMVFTEEEVDVPLAVQQNISEYVDLQGEAHNKILTSMQSALTDFQFAMISASAKDADPDIFGTMLTAIFKESVKAISDEAKLPLVGVAMEVYDKTVEELERAGKARLSLAVNEWANSQRAAIANRQRVENTRASLRVMKTEMEVAYLALSPDNRARYLDRLYPMKEALEGVVGPSVYDIEVDMFTQWINAHKGHVMSDAATGVIEYRIVEGVNADQMSFKSLHVKAPNGDKVETALNRLMREGHTSYNRAWDLPVLKRACFEVGDDNLRSWNCALVDGNNKIRHSDGLGRELSKENWKRALFTE